MTLLRPVRRPWLVMSGVGVAVVGAVSVNLEAVRSLLNVGAAATIAPEAVRWWTWGLLQSAAAIRLMGLTLWPVGLTVDADIDIIPLDLQAVAVGMLGTVALLAWIVRRRWSLVTYGLMWCILSLMPRLIVQTPRSYLNEAQWYVPLMGLILAAVAWGDSFTGRVVHG